MGSVGRILTALGSLFGLALLGIGIVYLSVACENLPGFLGPHPGDTSPRIGLGIAGVLLGTISVLAALFVLRRRRI